LKLKEERALASQRKIMIMKIENTPFLVKGDKERE